MQKITIGLVDDHKIVRQGLKELVEKLGNYKVIAEYDSAGAFLQKCDSDETPSVLIVDYSMPGMNGVDLIREIEKLESEYRTLLLTQHFDDQIIDAAYHYGARGFLHKNCSAADLKFAIDSIANTGYTNVVEILNRVRKFDIASLEGKKKHGIELTSREYEFLKLVCDQRELTYEQIADIMNVSVKSIEAYRTALFDKHDIKSKVGLVLFSYKYKLTEPFL
ncbi:response regulator transcription factor [Flavobacterium sp. MFBS3-15]|uniref:response regulator transcription factor n=1 Tax=Flavobacterium sp. MFBS3-15 TaxID=2989816 RepID=UPI0022360DA8|nr:response regulator transcription factor [Flavobacterium sp. MFBS3-15]MCW4469607.1 response regulator transcription factor [Flavobacterium sp. MFBS3-15]